MAKNNSINNEAQEITLDPGASGDSFVQFDINSTGEFRIGVDDTDDSFRLSQGSALGTNDTFLMTAAGERTMPLQPAFLAYLSATASNVTGDGTSYTVVCNTEIFDQGSDYNTTTGLFTAPVTGRYALFWNAHFVSDASGGSNMRSTMATSNRTYFDCFLPSNNRLAGFLGPNDAIAAAGSTIADMDVGDTAYLSVWSSGGSKTDDIYGGNCYTWIGGYLAV